MKKLMIIWGDRENSPAIEFINRNVEDIFSGYVELEDRFVSELATDEKLTADAYLCYGDRLLNRLTDHIDDFGKVTRMQRSPNRRAVDMIRRIPEGSDVLLVNDGYQSSLETIYTLCECNVGRLNYIPFDPELAARGIYDMISIAVTPGEPQLVPPHIKRVVDIGYREVSFESLLRVMQDLDLDIDRVRRNIFRHQNDVVEANTNIIENYINDYIKSEALKRMTDNSRIGMVLVDDRFNTVYANAKARNAFGVDDRTAVHISDYIDEDTLRRDDIVNEPISIRNNSYFYDKYAISIIDEVAGYYITLQDEQSAQPRKRNLHQKGYYARYQFKDITYMSEKMANVISIAKRIAQSSETVLIRGESGTGKELIAQSLHNYSERRGGPFVAINCAALPETLLESELFGYEPGSFTGARSKGKVGLFEQADGGTIFLDEIGDISAKLQSRLLRTIQEMQIMRIGSDKVIDIDVRIIAATNKNLEAEIEKGNFRRDLFYRINVLPLVVPPLRQRRDDIIPLLQTFLGANFKSVSSREKAILLSHNWPGNVRELKNVSLYYNSLSQLPEYLLEGHGNSLHGTDAGEVLSGRRAPWPVPASAPPAGSAKPGRAEEAALARSSVYWRPADENGASARYDENTLYLHVLAIIYSHTEPAHGVGRTTLVQMMKQSGINISDGKLREVLAGLASRGLVDIGRGRSGTRITEQGSLVLHNHDM